MYDVRWCDVTRDEWWWQHIVPMWKLTENVVFMPKNIWKSTSCAIPFRKDGEDDDDERTTTQIC